VKSGDSLIQIPAQIIFGPIILDLRRVKKKLLRQVLALSSNKPLPEIYGEDASPLTAQSPRPDASSNSLL
jgi:hypothetical protein